MKLIWYTVLIRAIPEALGMVLLILAILKEKGNIKNILLASLLCAAVAFTMRVLPIKFGMHSLIIFIIHTFIISIIFKIKIQKVLKGVLIAIIVLTISEILTLIFMQNILNIDPQGIFSTVSGTLLSGLPSVTILYVAALIFHKFNRKFAN